MTSGKESQPTVRGPLEKQLDLVVTQPGPRKGKAFLMVSTGAAAGTVFPLTEPSVLIGRSLDAQVSINEVAISNEHARIEQNGVKFTLRDLGSTNGTYVNGQRIVDAVLLAGGDTIRMGSTTFTFVTRESGLPKGTVKLNDPNPDLPIEPRRERAAEPHSVAMVPDSQQQTDSVSLTDVVRTVRTGWVYVKRYGWIVATCTCFGIAAGVVQAWVRPPPGSAWFEMTLSGPGDSDKDDGPQFFIGAENTFRSLPLIKKTLGELGAPTVSDATATDIQTALTFERVGFNSKVYRGDYEDATADLAVTFLQKHLHVYIDSELDKILKVLRTDAAFDRQQEEQADQRVAEARNRLVAFSDEHPEAVPKDAKLPEQQPSRLAPGASPERIKQSIASTERALRTAYTAIQTKKARSYLDQVASADNKIAEARARGLRDQHPEIRQLSSLQATMRAKANAILAAEPSPIEKEGDPNIARLEQELAELKARLAQMPAPPPTVSTAAGVGDGEPGGVKIAPVPPGAPPLATGEAPAESLSQLKIIYGELSREYERANTEHDALKKKREATDRTLERERTSAEARYGIITPPTPASRSMFSAMVKKGAMGGIVGLALAMIAAACLELRRILIARGHL
ncbi:MAG TPA: FHA domain-containing protein [Polyangiaceae bacterium]|nr:FHA domain-containing protein [Polyangiaceae bacterium]